MAHLQSRTSDLQTADALIYTGRTALCGFMFNPSASTTSTITIFDGLTATGKVLAKVITIVGATPQPVQIDFTRAVTAEIGIFADISNVTDYIVYHN